MLQAEANAAKFEPTLLEALDVFGFCQTRCSISWVTLDSRKKSLNYWRLTKGEFSEKFNQCYIGVVGGSKPVVRAVPFASRGECCVADSCANCKQSLRLDD